MTKSQKFITIPVLGALMLVGGGIAGYTGLAAAQSADTSSTTQTRPGRTPHVDGTITAIDGSTITITAEANHGGGTYSIDASGATITKDNASAPLSSYAVGGKIWVEGTINGTSVTATKISNRPGFGPGGMGGHGKGHGVMGTVSAVDGSTITVTDRDGTSYAVNAGSATVQKMVAGALSDVAVGDRIGVQGTVSGTTVTATTIMDDVPEMQAPTRNQ